MKVGFIGLGNVGGKLAGSLLRNGTDLTVYDLDAEAMAPKLAAGASAGQSPAQMMQDCDVVITCLPSVAACAAVMDVEVIRQEGHNSCKGDGWMSGSSRTSYHVRNESSE